MCGWIRVPESKGSMNLFVVLLESMDAQVIRMYGRPGDLLLHFPLSAKGTAAAPETGVARGPKDGRPQIHRRNRTRDAGGGGGYGFFFVQSK